MSFKFLASRSGQAVVEFTLGFLLFLMIFYAIVEFSHLLYTRLNMQYALSEAGRYMVTGQGISGEDPQARLKEIQNVFCANLIATGLHCTEMDEHMAVSCAGGACAGPGGGPGQTVTLSVQFERPWFTGLFNSLMGGPVPLTATTTWTNEPF